MSRRFDPRELMVDAGDRIFAAVDLSTENRVEFERALGEEVVEPLELSGLGGLAVPEVTDGGSLIAAPVLKPLD
ncbi:hypothetical protein HK107_06545 [Parvularcula sp. ZS-1/3]|uniref:Uncharacterized protein n=1 Tax=Parvularcula mediterranea TaxID=2732508 RepID=A0A7Y3RKY3_9PROT|nr:hypothetical protein [Parvularcula mediterranea]NNU15979.1 hypothetical protein [Parvularcula mediterranea]